MAVLVILLAVGLTALEAFKITSLPASSVMLIHLDVCFALFMNVHVWMTVFRCSAFAWVCTSLISLNGSPINQISKYSFIPSPEMGHDSM